MDVLPCPSRGALASASSAHCCASGTWLPAAAHGLKSSPVLTPQSNSCESCVWLRSASLSALCPILITVSGSSCQRMPSTWWEVLGLQGSSFQWFTSSPLLLFRMPRRAKCTARSHRERPGVRPLAVVGSLSDPSSSAAGRPPPLLATSHRTHRAAACAQGQETVRGEAAAHFE